MLYIENLCRFVQLMVENEEKGIFWPQNAEYSNTSELVKMIAEAHGKKMLLIPGFGWLLKLAGHATSLVNKAYGNLIYDADLSVYRDKYQIISLAESIKRTEK